MLFRSPRVCFPVTIEEVEKYIKSKPYDLIFTLAVAAAKASLIENKEGGNK